MARRVWQDQESGVWWLVVAGLAKGGHQDHEDFYERVAREQKSGDVTRWLPTLDDIRLLKQETAARIRTEWELDIQRQICKELTRIAAGGSAHFVVRHPVMSQQPLAGVSIEVSPVREAGYESDEVVVEIRPEPRGVSAALLWQLTLRVLISIEPPEQSWDRYADTYSTIGIPGAWVGRVEALRPLVTQNVLATSQPGDTSHLAHRNTWLGTPSTATPSEPCVAPSSSRGKIIALCRLVRPVKTGGTSCRIPSFPPAG